MADYVDNDKLTEELEIWAKKVREQIKRGETPDKMTDYIAECVLLICTNISYKSSFINYTYKEEMIGDAIENCIRYVKSFTKEKSSNAFGYISLIATRTFLRKIAKEKKRHIDHLLYIRNTFSGDEIRSALDADNPNDIKCYTTYVDYMLGILDDMDIEIPPAPLRKKREEKRTVIDDIFSGESY